MLTRRHSSSIARAALQSNRFPPDTTEERYFLCAQTCHKESSGETMMNKGASLTQKESLQRNKGA